MVNHMLQVNHAFGPARFNRGLIGWWFFGCLLLLGTDVSHAQFHLQELTDWFPKTGMSRWDAVISADSEKALIVTPGHLALCDLNSPQLLERRELAKLASPDLDLEGFDWHLTGSPDTSHVLLIAHSSRHKQVRFWLFGEELWQSVDADSLASWRRDGTAYAFPLLISNSGRAYYSISKDDELFVEWISLGEQGHYELERVDANRRIKALWHLPNGQLVCVRQSLPKTAGRVELWELDTEEPALRRISALPGMMSSDRYSSAHPLMALRKFRQNGVEHVRLVSPQANRPLASLPQAINKGNFKWASSAPIVAFGSIGATRDVATLYWVRYAGSGSSPMLLQHQIGSEHIICLSPRGDIVMTREVQNDEARYLIRRVAGMRRPDSDSRYGTQDSSGN